MHHLLRTMGCVKSKKRASSERGRGHRGVEKAYLVLADQRIQDGHPLVSPVMLEYAQRLSEEIVARAVQQWLEVDRRYVDIPYIECDAP